jgi:two-component system, OmpR family, phosphate regulon sensor histidine kinase PhoR
MSFRGKLFLTALAAAEIAAFAAMSLFASLHPTPPSGTATAIAFAGATLTGVAVAWTLSAPLARRVDALRDRVVTLEALGADVPSRLRNLDADRARLAAMLKGMIEGVLVVNEHGRLQLANDAARRLLRMEDAVEGRHYPEIVRHPAVAAQIAAVLSGGATRTVEISAPRDDSVTLRARAAAVEAPNGRGAVVVLHDITDLRRADRIRRDFVANVSHELRTPLTAIRGYVEALADAPPEQARDFLNVVSRHTQRMEVLVRDLLRLARLDARQERIQVVDTPVADLVAAAAADLAPLLAARAQRVDIDVAEGAHVIRVDVAKMQDVLRNLLENAANHSPEGAAIAVRARALGGRTRIEVQDSGPGIPGEDLTRVFERFYRVDKSRARTAGDAGTGLGLAIAKNLVELHGATITAGNSGEGGAIFTIDLPSRSAIAGE